MKAIIVHRQDGNQKSDWYPWLKKELEKRKWKVIIPKMPNTSEPKIYSWVNYLKKVAGTPDEETYFIGHSIGCQAIMRHLSQLPPQIKIGGLIFVAGWLKLRNLEDKDAKIIAKPWLETPLNFTKVKERTKNITVILSNNDPYVDYKKHKTLFIKKLKAKIISEKGKGHFTRDDGIKEIPEVVKELELMIT